MPGRLLGVHVESVPLLLIAALVAGYNTIFLISARTTGTAKLAANAQIALDLAALTAVLHFSGGITNPFYLYYGFHIVIASILLSARETFFQAALAILLFAAMAAAEMAGIVPHVPVRGVFDAAAFADFSYLVSVVLALASALIIAAAIATSIVAHLRAREAEILRLKDSLQKRTYELEAAYEQLRQVDVAKSEYILKTSHELRAPLATVETLLTVAREGFLGELPEKCRDLLERACFRINALQTMVSSLLILSRARERISAKEPILVDVRREVANMIPGFSAQAARKGIHLAYSLPEEMPGFYGDPEALAQFLHNLVSNAIRYTEPNGTVLASVEVHDAALHLVVSDTGIGIEHQDMDRIFEEFYRTERAREMVKDGSGLGLAIVKALVDAHGGSIRVDSEPGRGTTFSVTLPFRTVEKQGQDRATTSQSAEAPDRRNYGLATEQTGE
ncbi:MAG: HAMP domain-containing histidine kinase [Chloroflexi bacterium]|nr:HAMP domain-containing histidine kinase [Chloroflexota bacterium]